MKENKGYYFNYRESDRLRPDVKNTLASLLNCMTEHAKSALLGYCRVDCVIGRVLGETQYLIRLFPVKG
jgi:hypothetical protein